MFRLLRRPRRSVQLNKFAVWKQNFRNQLGYFNLSLSWIIVPIPDSLQQLFHALLNWWIHWQMKFPRNRIFVVSQMCIGHRIRTLQGRDIQGDSLPIITTSGM